MLLVAVLLLCFWLFRTTIAAGLVLAGTLLAAGPATQPTRIEVARHAPRAAGMCVEQPAAAERVAGETRDAPTWLGVTTGAVPLPARAAHFPGLVIRHVVPDSPAWRAGLLPGDVLLSLADRPLWSPYELRALVRSYPAGSEVRLTVMRRGLERSASVVLEPQPER